MDGGEVCEIGERGGGEEAEGGRRKAEGGCEDEGSCKASQEEKEIKRKGMIYMANPNGDIMLTSNSYPVKGFLLYNYSKTRSFVTKRGTEMADQLPEKWKQNIPDIYFDRLQVTTSVLGVNLVLGLSDAVVSIPRDASGKVAMGGIDVAVIRTSPTHAKLVAMLIKKQLKQYEENTKTKIQIPEDVYKELGLDS